MSAVPLSPHDCFMRCVRAMGAQRGGEPNEQLYAMLGRQLDDQRPVLSPAEHTEAVREIARACGV